MLWDLIFIRFQLDDALCRIKFLLRLLATRTLPVVGQVFKGNAVVLCGIIDVTADGADILAGCFLVREIHFGQNGRHRMIEIHHALGLQVLIALWGVGAAIDGGVVADELAHTVLRLAGSWQVGIYQNHLATRINQIVLKTAAIADVLIKFLFPSSPPNTKG